MRPGSWLSWLGAAVLGGLATAAPTQAVEYRLEVASLFESGFASFLKSPRHSCSLRCRIPSGRASGTVLHQNSAWRKLRGLVTYA